MDAFSAAIDALFADPNVGEDAVWRPSGAGGVPIRVVRRQPDRVTEFGGSRALMPAVVFEVRRSQAPTLAEGDLVEVGAQTFRIIAEPTADSLELVLTCEAAEV
jgi:hypothetical protein